MSGEDDFTPRLGRAGDRGKSAVPRASGSIRKAAARLGPKKARTGFRGSRIGRGTGAVPQATRRPRGMNARYMRRVTVKVHIARAGRQGGGGALAAHLKYVQRDGVERDGSGGLLYDRENEAADARAFLERCEGDRHQFRIIVSAEDAIELGDLKLFTRRLMADMERDTGTRLDWVAVDHHNTGHPHTHIVIRGKDEAGRDLVIAPAYLMQGLRGRAGQLATEELGPRRELDILRAEQRETTADRFTGTDRKLSELAQSGRVIVPAAGTSGQRADRAVLLQRLRHLEGLHLARPAGAGEWELKPGWETTLKSLGSRDDIIRSLAAGRDPETASGRVGFFADRAPGAEALTGTVLSQGPEDELRDRRFLLVQDFSGAVWHVSARGLEPGELPPTGAVVEVSAKPAAPRQADRTIAEIAARNGGVYSDALHAAHDPDASATFRLAHKRRLEALRMQGVVSRSPDGLWHIPGDFPGRAAEADAARGGGVAIRVRSWMALEAQVAGSGGSRLEEARAARTAFLREKGLIPADENGLSGAARERLRAGELARAAAIEAAGSGRQLMGAAPGAPLEGRFERVLDLARGRMALIGTATGFAFVPWRREMERYRGQTLILEAGGSGRAWTFSGGRGREMER
jgi:type IV secretory pathway VirD2 relaxase